VNGVHVITDPCSSELRVGSNSNPKIEGISISNSNQICPGYLK
jgi:hypothetical protein